MYFPQQPQISGTALGYGLDDQWFESRQGLGIFLFTTASRLAMVPTQTPIQWVPGALSLGVKRPGREADHSPPSSAEVKECVEDNSTLPIWRSAQLMHRDNFTFTFTLFSQGEIQISHSYKAMSKITINF
jgi:hypothetical protein